MSLHPRAGALRSAAAVALLAACGRGVGGAPEPVALSVVSQTSGTTQLLIGVSPVNERVVWVPESDIWVAGVEGLKK